MSAEAARKIFERTLLEIDAGRAVEEAVSFEETAVSVKGERFGFESNTPIFVIAIGKAAASMAQGLSRAAGKRIKRGVISGIVSAKERAEADQRWKIFEGGHPLPNEASFDSAREAFDILDQADRERGVVIYLISGGGSAMMELPKNASIGLSDLRDLNQILVTSEASIAEINAVRRAVSSVKGGGLSERAPNAKQISLIISDTSAGDVSSVASGPSLAPAAGLPDAFSVIEKYELKSLLPKPVIETLSAEQTKVSETIAAGAAYVLLDNRIMTEKAAEIARELGFAVMIDKTAEDVPIEKGCRKLLGEFLSFRDSAAKNQPVCFISGGEFSCKVNGDGYGGRNSETVLRLLLLAEKEASLSKFTFLSAGTDGIDGRSLAAGAVADETSFARAQEKGLDPHDHLSRSDSYTFFSKIGGNVMTGPTGTNVRDLRILISN
ncbi:MAG: DUF4147 domain-containing protein [Pyrinomonadaceae bacterium]